MARIPVGLQLYSVREDCKKDLPAVLAAVAKMGYDGVEFAGYHNLSAKELRKLLDGLKLKCCGTHIGIDTLTGDALKATIAYNLELGNPYLIVPWVEEKYRNSRAACENMARLFNGIAEKLAPHKLRTGYHNHDCDSKPIDGCVPLEVFGASSNRDVILQVDTANMLHGGGDPVAYLKKFPGRAGTVHLKEFSKINDKALIGEGEVKWKEVFAACEGAGKTEWYIVEQESYATPPLECVAQCLKNLRKMGK